MRRTVAWTLLVLGLIVGTPTATAITMAVRADPPGSVYVQGFLQWNAETSQGRIAWSRESPPPGYGAEVGGAGRPEPIARPPTDGLAFVAQSAVDEGTRWTDRWESEPLPRDLKLNASSAIQLDLHRKGALCTPTTVEGVQVTRRSTRIDVDLRLDGKQLGFWFDGMRVAWTTANPQPPSPLGYCTLHVRMSPETDLLPKGSRLQLIVRQHAEEPQQPPTQFGMKGRAQSVLRLPTYPAEEALYRSVDFDSADPASLLGGPTTQGSLAILALGMMTLRPRRRTLAFALALAMSGCLGSAPDAPSAATDRPASTGSQDVFLPPSEGFEARDGAGHVLVRVRNHLHNPVPKAGALLSGLHLNETGRYGNVAFLSVAAGVHTLSVWSDGYQSFTGTIEVRQSLTTRKDVTLVPLGALPGDLFAHRHGEAWAGGESLPLPEASAGSLGGIIFPAQRQAHTETCYNTGTYSSRNTGACFASLAISTGTPVPPGTARIEARLNWPDGINAPQKVGLAVRHNEHSNPVMLAPRAAGETFHIPVTWEMVDAGHQKRSTWEWFAYVVVYPGTKTSTAGPFKLTGTMFRGVLPLEPPHPDPWKGNNTIQFVNGLQPPGHLTASQKTQHGSCNDSLDDGTHSCVFALVGAELIPAGARWIEVQMQVTRPNAATHIHNAPDLGWRLLFRTAAEVSGFPNEAQLGPGVQDGRTVLYKGQICLTSAAMQAGLDGAYQARTLWAFSAVDNTDEKIVATDGTPYSFKLKALVHRTEPTSCGV